MVRKRNTWPNLSDTIPNANAVATEAKRRLPGTGRTIAPEIIWPGSLTKPNRLMELTQTYKHKASIHGLRTSYQQMLLAFIDRHADVFEALTRQGDPFGGNWWPVRQRPASSSTVQEQITRAQQQVNELTQTVSLLSDQIRSIQSSEQGSANVKPSAEVGINRFRALQAR